MSAQRAHTTEIVATSLLLIVLALFLLSSYFEPEYPWLAWVRSFSEAASVGAIADWFAVTALFRHPLGLPIPHTAIVARQRDRLAKGMGEFIDRNFLSGDVLRRKIVEENISLIIVQWASQVENSKSIAQLIKQVGGRSLYLLEDRAVVNLIRTDLKSIIKEVPLAAFCGRLLRFVIESDQNQEVVIGLISLIDRFVTTHKQSIERFVADKLPWYIPKFLHEPTFNQFLAKIREEIRQIESDPKHPAREKFRAELLIAADELQTSDAMKERGEKIKELLLESELFEQYIALFTKKLSKELQQQFATPNSPLSSVLESAAQTFVQQLKDDGDLQRALNLWLFDILNSLVSHSSLNFSYLVQEVVSSWDTDTLVERIEAQVKGDLQYIRINGTVIGGLVGLALHFIGGLTRRW